VEADVGQFRVGEQAVGDEAPLRRAVAAVFRGMARELTEVVPHDAEEPTQILPGLADEEMEEDVPEPAAEAPPTPQPPKPPRPPKKGKKKPGPGTWDL
jgi:hypothetical protein